jgi:hypothetical protein
VNKASARITAQSGSETFRFTAEAFDVVMDQYLPTSILRLREIVRAQLNDGDFHPELNDIHTVTELLWILAARKTAEIELDRLCDLRRAEHRMIGSRTSVGMTDDEWDKLWGYCE